MFLHYRSSSPPHTYARENRHHFVTLSMRDRFSTEVQRVYTDTPKKHTIRSNYPLWLKRITEVQAGKAVLSVRQWTGKPYRSPQEEIAILTNEDGLGIQELKMIDLFRPTTINGNRVELPDLAANDGLSFNDWYDWFKSYDLKQPMAIIHFTKFRY